MDEEFVAVWNIAAAQAGVVLSGHTQQVTAVAFSADSHWIATGSRDLTVRLWDARSGILDRVLEGHTLAVNCLVFSPNSHEILSGSLDGTIRAWDLDTRECRVVADGGFYDKGRWTISTSSNGLRAASITKSIGVHAVIDLWDAESWRRQQSLEFPYNLLSIAFSSFGRWVGVGYHRSVQLWNFVTDTSAERGGGSKKWKCSVRIRDIFGEVFGITWKPDTLGFSIRCSNGFLQVWRLVETSASSDAWSAQLVWSTGNPVLAASDAVFADAD
ncbi:hypothetical protein EC957_010423, partial [Mortierella hygrophila]